MKAVILAAGMGKRISSSIGGLPKSMLKINGETIISRSVRILESKGLKVGACVGYRANTIIDELKGRKVHFVKNPFFEVSNNIVSLWMARDFLDDDTIVLSADLVYEEGIIDRITESEAQIGLAVDSSKIITGDYFLEVDKQGRLISYGKAVPESKRSFSNVGIAKISKSSCRCFKKELNDLVLSGEISDYFEQVFFNIGQSNRLCLKYIDVRDFHCNEIDFFEDFKSLGKARNDFKKR